MRQNTQLISVIVPIYNVEKYLDKCVDSILNQTYTNLEIILVDDGSPDRCPEICDKYAKKDKRVKVIHQDNGGVSKARNRGLAIANGEWIMFVDGDDMLPNRAVEYLLKASEQSKAGCVCGAIRSFKNDDGKTAIERVATSRVLSADDAIASMLYQQEIVNAPFAKLYRRSEIVNIRFPEDITVAEDLYFNYFAMSKLVIVMITDAVVYLYRNRSDSAISNTFNKKRMTGLLATRVILDDAIKNQTSVLPAIDRNFMEAVFIGMQIVDDSKYFAELNSCREIICQYRGVVLHDSKSPVQHRAIALLSYLNVHMILRIMKWRSSIKRKIIK